MTVLQICSPGSHQRADCSLIRGEDAEGCGTLNARDGAVENDRATIPQERQCLLHRKQRSPYIDVEQFVEMRFGDGLKGNKFANTSVGENNIDSPLHLGDGLVKTIKVGQFGNVSLNARNVGADCLHGLVKFLRATARDEDVCTFFDEKLCRSQSNPFCAAGDDGGLAFELFGHCLSPLLLSWNSPAPMLHARSLESEHRLNDIPRIKFLWRAPKSRAHLDCPIQGRA